MCYYAQVSDLTLMRDKNKLIGCSFNKAFVGLWVVDLKDVSAESVALVLGGCSWRLLHE